MSCTTCPALEMSPIPAVSPLKGLQSLPARFIDRLARAYRQHRELAHLEALPLDLRKDIGWPAADLCRHRQYHSAKQPLS
ncbi:hypothetical protein ACFSE1_01590 [Rhizobium helianthi]|uniref:DUF1127 domain-containing protein n=1 Tax=Rhizobium helianthi TaxID=1132695 RepID=A0ABW4LYF8_9HYPH